MTEQELASCCGLWVHVRTHMPKHTCMCTHSLIHTRMCMHTRTLTHKRRCEGVIGAANEGPWAVVKSGMGNSSDKTDSLNENFIPPSDVVRLLDCSIVRLLKDISGMS